LTSEQIPPRAQPADASLSMAKIEHRRRTPPVTCTSCRVTFMPSALAGPPVDPKEWVCQRCTDRLSEPPPEPDSPEILRD
jgi:hypothetical protein